MPPWRVVSVQAVSPYRLQIAFHDGTQGEVDLRDLIFGSEAGVFATLRDEALFERMVIAHGAVAWPGEIDVAPDALYAAVKTNSRFPIPDSRFPDLTC